MREVNKIAESLFEKIRDRFEDVSLGDENAKATQNPVNARFFNFDFLSNGVNYGNITVSIIDESSLKVYFSKNLSKDMDPIEKKGWYDFLRELREFSKRNLLSFEPRDITRPTLKHRDVQQVSKADDTYSKDEVVTESRLYGTSRSSYENDGPVRIIIRHSDHVNPEKRGDRSRKIRAMYLETHEGERLKLPHNNLRYARAMARHVAEGGSIGDEFGQHITRIAEECSKLRPFKHSVMRRTFEDQETQEMVEAAFEYHALLNNTLKRISGRKGYAACKESFTHDDPLTDDFDVDSLRERFVKRTYNDKMDDALPIVQKAYKMKKQNKFSDQFESWANDVVEGTWDLPDDTSKIDQLIDLLSEELPLGVDGSNATNALYNIIGDDQLFDMMGELAEENPEQDARDIILSWLEENEPAVYQQILDAIGDDSNYPAEPMEGGTYGASGMDEPNVNEEWAQDQVDMIATAIIRKITNDINKHADLLRKAGPYGLINAARDVASFHAPVEELGSSDVSAMVREVYNEVGLPYPEMSEDYQPLEEGKMKDIALDIEELSNKQFYAKYKMSKDDMKAKLAEGQGANYGEELAEGIPYDGMHRIRSAKRFIRAAQVIGAKVEDEGDELVAVSPKSGVVVGAYSRDENAGWIYAPGTDRENMKEDDYVDRDEKLKRVGAKPLGMLDKLKTIPQGMRAMAKGEPEDDVSLYNKSRASLEEMRRLAGLEK